MPTLFLNKGGSIVGTVDTTQAAARDEANGTSISQDVAVNGAIQYFKSAGRGGGTFRYIRSFLQFDSTQVTSTVASATLNIESHGNSGNGDVIVVASSAFGGTNSDLVNSDFSALDFSTTYSSEVTTWNINGSNNAITLNAAALSALQNNNSFICAVINHDSDFQDTDPLSGDGSETNGIDFAGTISISLTLAPTSEIASLNTVARTSISSFNTVPLASIDKINTLDN